jgi:glycosyltransferase involved in cell wall biosynthesis
MTPAGGSSHFPLAYVVGRFPVRSETFVYREVRGLRERGWPVIAVSLHEPDPTEDADLERDRLIVYDSARNQTLMSAAGEILRHPIRSLGTLLTALGDTVRSGEHFRFDGRLKIPLQAVAALGLARRLRERGVRHIHCHFAHAPTTVGMYAAMQMGIPFSFTGHANDIFRRRSILKIKLRRAAFVACISRWHQALYSSILADSDGKYEVIRCGVDVNANGKMNAGSGGGLRLLTVARLVEKKGIDTAISALAELNKCGVRAHLTIAGDGPDRGRLEKMAADLNCRDQITWLGAVCNSRVFALLGEADLFALPSRQDSNGDRDGIPVVLMEAMAAGIPVVAGDLPAIRELVEDGVTGFLVEENQPGALADKLAMLWENADLRERLAREGKKRVEKEFSLSLNLDRLERRFSAARKIES